MPQTGSDSADASFFDDAERICNFRPQDFKESVVIGKGKDCLVYAAYCVKLDCKRVAVKVYDKAKLSASKLRAVKREAAMMIYMTRKRVPLITQFYGAFQDAYQIFLVMEYCSGGDLLERLLKEGRAMAERRVILEVAVPLLRTLQHMHSYSIIHRDVKLENVFIGGDGRVRLGDFGLTMSMKQEMAISPVGTVEYMAPEVVALPPVEAVISGAVKTTDITACNEKVDIWALGVTLYELLQGHLPFEGEDKAQIKQAIALGIMRPFSHAMSPSCRSFISAMLARDSKARPSARQLLNHPIVLAYTRVSVMPLPLQPQMSHPVAGTALGDSTAAAHLLSSAPVSDSVSSLDGHPAAMAGTSSRSAAAAAAGPKHTAPGAQGTITINVSGSQTALSGSFSVRHGQVATSVPELAATPHPHLMTEGSGGSLIKAKHAAFQYLNTSTMQEAGSSASSSDMFSDTDRPSDGSGSSADDAFRAATGASAGSSRPSSPLLRHGRPASAQAGLRPSAASGSCLQRRSASSMQQDDPVLWPHKTTVAQQGQPVRPPSPLRMSKQHQQYPHHPQQHSHGGKAVHPSEAQDLHLLPPRPPAAAGCAAPSHDSGESSAANGLMTRVTSLFNRALCKPSASLRGASSPFVDDRHPAAHLRKQHA